VVGLAVGAAACHTLQGIKAAVGGTARRKELMANKAWCAEVSAALKLTSLFIFKEQ